jgi:DNA-binding MarR family transcriptional regulator
MNENKDLWITVTQAARMAEKSIDRRCRKLGISASGLEALWTLEKRGPVTAYRLAKIMAREHHSVVELVNRMRSKGQIRRDGLNLHVTDDGRGVMNTALGQGALGVFESIGKKEAMALEAAMRILGDAAKKDMGILGEE